MAMKSIKGLKSITSKGVKVPSFKFGKISGGKSSGKIGKGKSVKKF